LKHHRNVGRDLSIDVGEDSRRGGSVLLVGGHLIPRALSEVARKGMAYFTKNR
jgi:hypothetical protein